MVLKGHLLLVPCLAYISLSLASFPDKSLGEEDDIDVDTDTDLQLTGKVRLKFRQLF